MGPSARQRSDSETSNSSSSDREDPHQVTTAASASTFESKMNSLVMSLKGKPIINSYCFQETGMNL